MANTSTTSTFSPEQLRRAQDKHRELNSVRDPSPEEKKRKLFRKDTVAGIEADLRQRGVIQ